MNKYSELFLDKPKDSTSKYSDLFLDEPEVEKPPVSDFTQRRELAPPVGQEPSFLNFLKDIQGVRDAVSGILKPEEEVSQLGAAQNIATAIPRFALSMLSQPHAMSKMMEEEPPPPEVMVPEVAGQAFLPGKAFRVATAEQPKEELKKVGMEYYQRPEELFMDIAMLPFLKHVFSMKPPPTRAALARPSVASQAARFEEMARPKITPSITEKVVPQAKPKKIVVGKEELATKKALIEKGVTEEPAPAGKGISPKREAELKTFADRSLDQVERGKPAGRTFVWPEAGERGPIKPTITADASTYPQWYRDLTRDYSIKKSQTIKALKQIKEKGMEADGRQYVENVKASILEAMTKERSVYAQEILKERAKRGVLTDVEKELYSFFEKKGKEFKLTEEVKAKPGAKQAELGGLQRAEAEALGGGKIKKVTGTKAIKEEMLGRPEGEVLPGQEKFKPAPKTAGKQLWRMNQAEWKTYKEGRSLKEITELIKQRERGVEAEVIDVVSENPDITYPDLQRRVGVEHGRIGGATERLEKKGVLEITEGEMTPGGLTPSRYRLKQKPKPSPGKAAGKRVRVTRKKEVETFAGKGELPRPTEPSTPQDILKKSEIIKSLREKLEIPVRTGRFRERAKGIYKRREQVVRLKSASDLPTLSHEIGHHIEEIIFPKRVRRLEQIRKYQKEVISLTREAGFPKRLQTRAEGFAEFVRLYITDPKQAQAKTPKFYAHFEGKMTEFPELQDILLGARRDIQRWVNQPATAKVLSQVSVAAKEPSDVSINRIYTMTVDDLRPIQVAVKEMSGGRLPRDIANDPFRQAWLLRGWTGKANAFLDYGIMDKAGNKIFPSFKEILKPVSGDLDAFRTYGVAKRALERHRKGFETGIDPRDASASLAELSKKSPAYDKVFKQLVEFQDKVLEYLSESGVVGAEELSKLRQASKDYLPFYRVFEETKVKGFRTGRGIANLADPVKRFRGSGREIVDPLESIIKNVYAIVSIAERNKVASTLVNLAGKTKGGGKWVESLPTPQKGWQFKVAEIEKILVKSGAKDVDVDVIARIFRPSIFAPAKENILTVFRHGKPKFYQVQPDLYRALLALDQESSGVLVRILSKPARMLRAGATLTPEFSLYRNPFRDQMTAFIYSKYGYRPGIDLARGLFHAIKKDDLFWKWQSSGGAHASLVSLDRNYLQGALRRMLRQRVGQIAKDVVVHPIETLRALSEFTEEATRIGEFKRGLEKGASLQEAALASRDVTLDFARVGAKGRIPNQLIAFFNAQVQGADKMVRSFKENPTRSTVKAIAGITIPSLILYSFNRDNPRYKELPVWRKDLFWNIPAGNRFISIPKPFELGIIFGSFPERLFEWVDTQDPGAFDDLAKNFWESLTPNVLPTALQPIIEVVANRSFFTGRPIVSEGRKRLIPSEQYSPYTPETFKAMGRPLGVSPAKLEHVWRGYTAGLGRLPIAGMEKLVFNPPKRPRDIAYTPMLRGIVTPEPTGFRSRSVQRFYDFKEKVNRLHATWKTLSGDEAKRFKEKHSEIKSNSSVNEKAAVLSDLRKQRQRIMDNPDITVEEKKRRIKEKDERVIRIVQSFLRKMKAP